MAPRRKPTPAAHDANTRLVALLKTKDFVPFHVDMPDREYTSVTLSIYGATKTNELFVKLTNGKLTFVEAIPSPLCYPGMAYRVFGMDEADSNESFSLANRMWEKHKSELIGK